MNYGYDANGNRNLLKFDGTTQTSYAYDAANRLTTLTDEANQNFTFGYDIANRLISKALPNGVNTTYDYDGMSRLTRLKNQSPSATLTDNNYGYNPASQISSIAELSQTKNYSYDNVDRLTGMTNGTANEIYAFDNVGNRTSSHQSSTYNYQPFNKLTNTATANYSYDANGNLLSKSEGKSFWRYIWDGENRMSSASTRKQTIRYKYDALGRRVQRYFIRGGSENTKYIYDGMDVVADDNGGVLTKYQNGLGIDDKLKVSINGTAKYFITDHLGSTVGLTNQSGAIAEQTSYDSFGNSANNLSTRYQFTGREYDSFTGLQYSRARWYDAKTGRFVSEDPIGFAGGDINLYGYVRNNSLRYRDPTGKIIPFIIAGAAIAVLILASPSPVNAPGRGDPIYYPENPLILNAAGGAVGSFVLGKVFGPVIGRFMGTAESEICELGIASGPESITSITNAGEPLGDFGIPKYYTYNSQGNSVYVAPHAMEHLVDLGSHGAGNPDYLRLLGQLHQESLHATIDEVLSGGPIKFNQIYEVGETEIQFGSPRNSSELPAVKHFRQK